MNFKFITKRFRNMIKFPLTEAPRYQDVWPIMEDIQALGEDTADIAAKPVVISGGSAPNDFDGKDGDTYINTSDSKVYLKIDGFWVYQTTLGAVSGAMNILTYVGV